MRRVDALFAELLGRFTQALPRLAQILRQVLRERRLGGRPAVVRFAFLDPLLAVVALSTGHATIMHLELHPACCYSC